MALVLGLPPLAGSAQAHMVVTEFSRSVQAFIVGAVDRIVHVDVANVEPPREGMVGPRINATTRVDGALVMIVDVEQILADVSGVPQRSEEHTSELQSLMRISYAVFCLRHNNTSHHNIYSHQPTTHY